MSTKTAPVVAAAAMEVKRFAVTEFKTLDADEPGTFEALVAVFNNVDSGGDRILPGAFAKTLKDGLPPVVWSHEWGIPPIGATLSADEVDDGLLIKARLLVGDDEEHAVARQVHAAMKAKDGRGQAPLRQFSFGYRAKDVYYVDEDEMVEPHHWRDLKEIELYEVGPTLLGMNRSTELLGVKAAGGRRRMTVLVDLADAAGDDDASSAGGKTDSPDTIDSSVDSDDDTPEVHGRWAELLTAYPNH